MIGGIEAAVVVLSGEVEGSGFGKITGLAAITLLLHGVEGAGVFFALPAKARFLDLQIAELTLVDNEGMDFDEDGALIDGFVSEHVSEFEAADGFEFFFVEFDVTLVSAGVVGREQNGAAGERGLDGIERGLGFAFFCAGARGEFGIGSIGGKLSFGERAGWRLGEFEIDRFRLRGFRLRDFGLRGVETGGRRRGLSCGFASKFGFTALLSAADLTSGHG